MYLPVKERNAKIRNADLLVEDLKLNEERMKERLRRIKAPKEE